MSKSRPSVTSFLSSSTKARQTQQDLSQAQAQITQLEQELASERQRIESQVESNKISQAMVPIDQIQRRPYKSRREKDPQAFQELVHSIAQYGFRGSIWLQRLPDGQLRLVAGETRLNAAIAAGLTEIAADIASVDDVTAVKLSRVENARRRNLNALDDTEELLYLLMLVLQQSREQVKKLLYRYKNAAEGNSSVEPHLREKIESVFAEVAPELSIMTFVSSRLPLLDLPEEILAAYAAGQLEYTKAVVLGRIEDTSLRNELLQEVIEFGLSLSAIKQRIRPTSSRTVADKIEKLQGQVQGIDQKSYSKLSREQRERLKRALAQLTASLYEKNARIREFRKRKLKYYDKFPLGERN